MPDTPLPSRPRLAEHAVVRRHRAGGEDAWILHDQRSGVAYRLGAREWGLVSKADGTRDLEGIVAAAARDGTFAKVPALMAFLTALAEAGLLAEGVGPVAEPAPRPPNRPLDPLPGFSLVCDGQGSCCRFYSSIIFRPIEEAYARVLLPRVLDAGDKPEDAFMPLHGSSVCGASAVGLVDGRCAYLENDGRCGLHAARDALAKPLGCRTFPVIFVDDGEAVRVGPVVECACVLESALASGEGEPLVQEGMRSSHDLDAGIHVTTLPEAARVTDELDAPRTALVAFSRALVRAPAPLDAARALVALSSAIALRGLDVDAIPSALSSTAPIEADLVRPFFASLAARAERRVRIDASYRSERDLARRVVRFVFKTAAVLAEDRAGLDAMLARPPSVAEARAEEFLLRAEAHTYQLFSGDLPIRRALLDRAVRVLLARAMPLVLSNAETLGDPVFRHPLALVTAAMRGHGLEEYAETVAPA